MSIKLVSVLCSSNSLLKPYPKRRLVNGAFLCKSLSSITTLSRKAALILFDKNRYGTNKLPNKKYGNSTASTLIVNMQLILSGKS